MGKLASGHSAFKIKYGAFAVVLNTNEALDRFCSFTVIKPAKSPAPILFG